MLAQSDSHPHASSGLNERQCRVIEDRLHRIAFEGQPAIAVRLQELNHEWSAGRVAKIIAATGILAGLAVAMFVSWWALMVPVVLALTLLQHLTSHECWLTHALRPLGLRSGKEIEHERFALRALRGDFNNLPTVYERADEDALSRLEGEGGIVNESTTLIEDNRAAVKDVLDRVDAHR